MPKFMGRFPCNKFAKSPSKETERSRKDRGNSLSTKSSVNEEYLKAFRSESYEEIWDKVRGHLGLGLSSTTTTSTSATEISSSSLDLSKYLLEPRQETLMNMIESVNFHHLLVEYFEASLQACNICELLLRSINQARSDYRKIKRVIKISKRVLVLDDHVSDDREHTYDNRKQYCRAVFSDLKAIALLKTPLSIISPLQFRDIRDGYVVLLHKLVTKRKKIKRRERISMIFKKVGGVGLLIMHNALLIALLIFAFHSIFGIILAPTLVGCPLVYLCKKRKKTKRVESAKKRQWLGEQFDVAAKGIFILINDLDTMCQMVRRLQDQIEHRKSVAEICVRNGKFEVLREVVKELSDQEPSFLEQLEELEGHIYLCLLTINRSRRLVIQEIIGNYHYSGSSDRKSVVL